LRDTTWEAAGQELSEAATRTIERYAPGFAATVVARQIITPATLETVHGLPGGHIFQGELALDQMFIARPLLGWARFNTPIPNLFLCGAGSYPGTGFDGRSGALAARHLLAALTARNGKW
jgi:phytoene dehydrogenase-like protein